MMIRTTAKSVDYSVSGQSVVMICGSARMRYIRGSLLVIRNIGIVAKEENGGGPV
jgi:hypothetical protein